MRFKVISKERLLKEAIGRGAIKLGKVFISLFKELA